MDGSGNRDMAPPGMIGGAIAAAALPPAVPWLC